MNQQLLDNLQERLENCSKIAQDKAFDIAKIRNMKYGVGNVGRFSDAEINQVKSQVKTDIAGLIKELTDINNLIQ